MAPPSSPIPLTLLTLRLSSPSFLETILTDNSCPVYSTETYGSTTSLSRCDPVTGLTLVASIHWPERALPDAKGKGRSRDPPAGARLSINGFAVAEDELLKRNRFNTSRKFRVPGHAHSLKWRRVQGVFQCTTSAGVPVAVFEPAIITARARLNVFLSTLSGLHAEPERVSAVLVDYLLVTALLLLTHPEDWHGFAPAHPPPSRVLPLLDIPAAAPYSLAHPHPYCYSSQPCSASTSSPVSPITSAVSSSSSSSSSFSFPTPSPSDAASSHCLEREQDRGRLPSPAAVESPWLEPRHQSRRTDPHASLCPEFKDDGILDYEPPPPYEEIQWTVRVRQPRRFRI